MGGKKRRKRSGHILDNAGVQRIARRNHGNIPQDRDIPELSGNILFDDLSGDVRHLDRDLVILDMEKEEDRILATGLEGELRDERTKDVNVVFGVFFPDIGANQNGGARLRGDPLVGGFGGRFGSVSVGVALVAFVLQLSPVDAIPVHLLWFDPVFDAGLVLPEAVGAVSRVAIEGDFSVEAQGVMRSKGGLGEA